VSLHHLYVGTVSLKVEGIKEYKHISVLGEDYVGCFVDKGYYYERYLSNAKFLGDYGNYEKCFKAAKA
jgi:hypothetical protein